MEQNPEAIDLDSNESLNLDDRRMTNWRSSSSSKVERLKRMVKFVVSVCVFSLFLSLFSVFPHSFSVYFSTFLFSFLNHAMERKYMFLICNGILFLLATSSLIEDSSSSSSSSSWTCSFSHSDIDHHDQFQPHLVAAIEDQNHEIETEEEEEVEEELQEEDQDEGCFTDEVEDGEEEEEEGKGSELDVVVSTEELNKKIEEFIRKMKEEMRIEAAQTQLIVV